MIILDTPEQIEMFAWLQVKYRLKIEVESGGRFRQSTLAAVNRALGTTFRSKKKCYEFVCELLEWAEALRGDAT